MGIEQAGQLEDSMREMEEPGQFPHALDVWPGSRTCYLPSLLNV